MSSKSKPTSKPTFDDVKSFYKLDSENSPWKLKSELTVGKNSCYLYACNNTFLYFVVIDTYVNSELLSLRQNPEILGEDIILMQREYK